MIKAKIASFFSYIKSIGVPATIDYMFQRYVVRKEMMVLNIPWIKEKIHLRRNSKDINVFQQIFIKKDLAFLNGRNYDVCIDAGANIGLSTIYMKNMFPDSHIYSIEPEPANIKMLCLNTKGYTNVTVISKAMSQDSNGLFFIDPGNGSDSFQTSREFRGSLEPVEIESISIRDLMNQYELSQVDFVKIDIEGAEDFCINQEAMSWINQTKLLAIEIHEHFVPGCGKKIRGLLKDNFKIYQNGEYSIFENRTFANNTNLF